MEMHIDRPSLEAIFNPPNNDGSYSEEQRAFLAGMGAKRPSVLLAFPPKAAGTFMRAAAVKATGGEVLRVCYAQGDRDAQPYLPTFLAYYSGGFCSGPMVTHIHMQAFPANVAFIEAFGIRPILMVRSIPDMLASYWDMVEHGGNGLPMGINCTIPDDFGTMSRDRRADFMIDVVAPWYAGYYATWGAYDAANPGKACILKYSDFVKQPAEVLQLLLQASGLPCSHALAQEAIEATWLQRHQHRFNKGVEGRSNRYFSASQIERIPRLLSYYPGTERFKADLLGL